MPTILSGIITKTGPHINVQIAAANSQQGPSGSGLNCLVDTGVSRSVIKLTALRMAGIKPVPGAVGLSTTAGGDLEASEFEISVWTQGRGSVCLIPAIRVLGDTPSNCQAVLGQDFLQHGILTYDGPAKNFDIEFI